MKLEVLQRISSYKIINYRYYLDIIREFNITNGETALEFKLDNLWNDKDIKTPGNKRGKIRDHK